MEDWKHFAMIIVRILLLLYNKSRLTELYAKGYGWSENVVRAAGAV